MGLQAELGPEINGFLAFLFSGLTLRALEHHWVDIPEVFMDQIDPLTKADNFGASYSL